MVIVRPASGARPGAVIFQVRIRKPAAAYWSAGALLQPAVRQVRRQVDGDVTHGRLLPGDGVGAGRCLLDSKVGGPNLMRGGGARQPQGDKRQEDEDQARHGAAVLSRRTT